MKNLAHSASFESLDKNAPSNAGTEHLGRHALESVVDLTLKGAPRAICLLSSRDLAVFGEGRSCNRMFVQKADERR